MKDSVRERLAKGFGANAYSQLINILLQLSGVPLLLNYWGVQLYGEWLILYAIPAYLAMSDFGFAQSAGNDMTAKAARKDLNSVRVVFHSLAVMILILATTGSLLTGWLIWILPLDEWLKFKAMSPHDIQLVLFFLTLQIFIGIINGITSAGLRCCGDYSLNVALDSTVRLIQNLAIYIAAISGFGPDVAAAAFCITRAISTALIAIHFQRRQKWLRYGFSLFSKRELRKLIKPATANILIPLAQAIHLQGMVIVIGMLIGPAAVVTFSTLRTMTRLALQPVLAISNTAEPELSRAHGIGDIKLMYNLYVRTQGIGLWLAISAAFLLLISSQTILRYWLQNSISMDFSLFSLLILSAVASVSWYTSLVLLKSVNDHLGATVILISSSLLAVGLSAAAIALTGQIDYAGAGLLSIDLVMAIYCANSAQKMLNRSKYEIFLTSINPLPLFYWAVNMCKRREEKNQAGA